MSGQSFGPFRIEILGGMDIDGDPRTGVFLSADIPQLRGVGAMMGDDVVIARADLPPTLEQAKALPEIKALVEAAEYILDGMGIDAPLYEIDPDDDFLDAANSEWVSDTLRMLATALRAIGEGGE